MDGLLLIVIDCLRADHVSCYGYHRATTPTIDSLARHGVRWGRAYSASSWTKPSVASLLTGLYPSSHGAFEGIKRSRWRPVATSDIILSPFPTLAENFAGDGWCCGAFVNNAQLSPFTQLDRGFETYLPAAGKADDIIAALETWLRRNRRRKWFAYVHFLEAHWPYKPRRRHVRLFDGNRDTNPFRDFRARDFGRLRKAVSRREMTLSDAELTHMVQMYDGAVRRLDGKVKRILATLDELQLRDRTAVVVTSDHGEEFLEHGKIGHGQSLFGELLHVPLVVSWNGAPAGRYIPDPVGQVDLAHTLLRLGGVEPELPGSNLLAAEEPKRSIVAELKTRLKYWQSLHEGSYSFHRRFRFFPEGDELDGSLTTHEWARTVPHDTHLELYDLQADPREQRNLADDPAKADVVHRLTHNLDQWWREACDQRPDAVVTDVALDEVVAQRLRDLGYLD